MCFSKARLQWLDATLHKIIAKGIKSASVDDKKSPV